MTDIDFQNPPNSARNRRFVYQGTIPVDSPRVSILTAHFNIDRSFFMDTFFCLLNQSYMNWEWIIIDDGSTVAECVEQLHEVARIDPRVKIYFHEHLGRVAAIRNLAATMAQGEFLVLLDADDLLEPTFIEKAVWFLKTHPQYAFCNSWTIAFGDEEYVWQHGFEHGQGFLDQNWVTPIAVMRRDVHIAVGGMDGELACLEDWEYWLRLAASGYWGATIPEYLAWYRRRSISLSKQRVENPARAELAKQTTALILERYRALIGHFPESPDKHVSASYDWSMHNKLSSRFNGDSVLVLLNDLANNNWSDFMTWYDKLESPIAISFVVLGQAKSPNVALQLGRWSIDTFVLDYFCPPALQVDFLTYLIESRDIRAIYNACSEIGDGLTFSLKLAFPNLKILSEIKMSEATTQTVVALTVLLAIRQAEELAQLRQNFQSSLYTLHEVAEAKTWLEEQVKSWQQTTKEREESIEQLTHAKTWLEGQVQSWQQTTKEREESIEQLSQAKTWLEGQVQSWQQTTKEREESIEQLTHAKTWLEGQVQNWQQTTKQREESIEELTHAKTWLEGQVQNWQQIADEHETWIGQLTEGKTWLEGQWLNWQHIAAEREEMVASLNGLMAQLRATNNANIDEIAQLKVLLKKPVRYAVIYIRGIIKDVFN